MDRLMTPPIGFAHRGARADAPENTLEAFALALRLGATGLESDVWLTADGVAVLDHDGVVRSGLRRRPIREIPAAELPAHIPSLADLYRECGTGFALSLDVKDPAAGAAVIAVARDVGAEDHLWLCHPDLEVLVAWRPLSPSLHLVDSTRLRRIKDGPERRAARHAALGVDAVNLHSADWSAGLATLWHRFGRCAFAWDAQQPSTLGRVLAMGVDAVYSDHVERMMAAIATTGGSPGAARSG